MAAFPAENDGGSAEALPRDELRPTPIKKLCIILLSFIPAVVILAITNVVLAHVFVLFPPSKQKADGAIGARPTPPKQPKAKKEKKKTKKDTPRARVETEVVYVPPTEDDLDRIRRELEESEPLPPIAAADDNFAARVQSVTASIEELLKRRDDELDAAISEIEDLAEAYVSFTQQFEQHTLSRDAPTITADDAKLLQQHIPYLRSILGRTAFMDLDRHELMQLFTLAMEDLKWLLSADDEPTARAPKAALLLNVNNSLLEVMTNGTTKVATDEGPACPPSYLDLDGGEASADFSSPPKKKKPIATTKSKSKVGETNKSATTPMIANDTARESDLHNLVETIKNTLARRDLTIHDKSIVIPSPISREGTDQIRARIASTADAIRAKWDSMPSQEGQLRDYWVGRTEALLASRGDRSGGPGGDAVEGGGMCASRKMVEGMVTGGLDALRRKGDLRFALVNIALMSLDDDPEATRLLGEEIKRVVVPKVDYEGKAAPRHASTSSSWKLSKKSIHYAVHGPLLRRGVAGWVDSFVDAISGYNDHLDALIDWAMGEDEGGSVGSAVVDTFLKVVRKVPFPSAEYVQQMKKGGILSGRARVILEE